AGSTLGPVAYRSCFPKTLPGEATVNRHNLFVASENVAAPFIFPFRRRAPCTRARRDCAEMAECAGKTGKRNRDRRRNNDQENRGGRLWGTWSPAPRPCLSPLTLTGPNRPR